MKGRQYRSYAYVEAESVTTKHTMKYWVDLALNYNKAIASTK